MYEKYTGLPDTAKHNSQRSANGGAGSRANSAGRVAYQQNTGRFELNYDEHYNNGYSDRTARSSSAHSSGASGSSSGSGSRGGSGRKRRRLRRRRLVLAASSLVLLALLVGAIILISKSCQEPAPVDVATDVFRSGVYINGADVSGKTIEEVRTQLVTNETYAINNIAITLSGDGFSKTITGADMGAYSDLDTVLTTALSGTSNQVYYTNIQIDDGALAQRIDEINQKLTSPPTDATFTVEISESGKPEFQYVDGKPGYGLDVEATKALVHEALTNKQYQTAIQPKLTAVEPTITVADVKAHTALIGSFYTTYDYKGTAEDTVEQREEMIPNRSFNVQKATDAINNQVIKPGYTFSFNDTVGDRNEKNGWRIANGIMGGDRYTKQYGGGVCQVSTTLYNALLGCYSNIDIVERRKHSIPSTYVDKGLDATVDTNHIDFRFKNVSDYPMYIFAYTTKNKRSSSRKNDIHVLIYGEALPDGVTYQTRTEMLEEILPGEPVITENRKAYIGEEQILAEPHSGYKVNVYIERCESGKVVASELMYMDSYEGNPLKKRIGTMPTPTPTPTATPQATHAPTPTVIPNQGELP